MARNVNSLGLSLQGIIPVPPPRTVAAVPTAIPVFIGYTHRAGYGGKSFLYEAVKINSLRDFLLYFGKLATSGSGTDPQPAPESEQYSPVYHVVSAQGQGDVIIGGIRFDLLPDPRTVYYLYNSLKLFYQNGGGTCYVISVGPIGQPSGQTLSAGSPLINPGVHLEDLQKGLEAAMREETPAILLAPDALLLPPDDYATYLKCALQHCGAMQSRFALLDVYGGQAPDPATWFTDQIVPFRNGVGLNYLDYGAAYYPFLQTSIVQPTDINFNTLGGLSALAGVLHHAGVDPLNTILNLPAGPTRPTDSQIDQSLLAACSEYGQLRAAVLQKLNILPPSGAMAGVYALVDHRFGVWQVPGNCALAAVCDTTLNPTDADHDQLKMDAATGKSINAIRNITGLGFMIWDARTLNANSQDWRDINIRRTMIMIEQSVKQAARAYVFDPNTAATWESIKTELTVF